MQIVLAAILAMAYASPAPRPVPKPVARPDIIAPLAYSALSYDTIPSSYSFARSDPLVFSSPIGYTTDLWSGARILY